MLTYDTAHVDKVRQAISFIPNMERALFMAEKMRVDFVYNTAALEGNPYTYPEIKTLIEGITVGGHRISDTEQVLNLNRALSHVIDLVKSGKFELNKETACTIQGIVANRESLTWGEFRDGQVFIGGTNYLPPRASDLDIIFEQGAKLLNTIDDPTFKAWLIFLWGSLNQFFYDGNKRTSRFLANATLMSAGLPPLMILAKDQLKYNEVMTRFYDNQDATEALEWLYSYYVERIAGFGFKA
ncbi:Fic/DOC family protein [Hydromonas duriensis]|uniref:Fic/DOC family protein n=2 Tax=Hydromonas duriensis TaxID=1527608 RepID=A0A4R6Y5I0_9BURK|nr:Fic/DOC family protein [Hydromonas duriensis]